jgi:hypothetical protein
MLWELRIFAFGEKFVTEVRVEVGSPFGDGFSCGRRGWQIVGAFPDREPVVGWVLHSPCHTSWRDLTPDAPAGLLIPGIGQLDSPTGFARRLRGRDAQNICGVCTQTIHRILHIGCRFRQPVFLK